MIKKKIFTPKRVLADLVREECSLAVLSGSPANFMCIPVEVLKATFWEGNLLPPKYQIRTPCTQKQLGYNPPFGETASHD